MEGLIDFDDPQRSESILAGCVRQSTDNPLKKNSFDQYDIDGIVDIDMINAMYNNTDYATGQPSEKNSFDSVRKTNESDSFSYEWNGVANTEWDVVHKVKNDNTVMICTPMRKIFEYYENKYGTSELDCTIIDSIIGDLKDAGFDMDGNPLKESKDQKNFLDEMFQDASCYASKSSEKKSFDVVEKRL